MISIALSQVIGRPSEIGVHLHNTTLKPNTLYRFRVLARSSTQEAPASVPLTVMTPPLGPIGDVALVQVLSASVRVKWHAHMSAADSSVKWVVQVKESSLELESKTETMRFNARRAPHGTSAQNFRVSPLRSPRVPHGQRRSSGVQTTRSVRSRTPRRSRPVTTPRRSKSRQREPGSTPWGYARTPTPRGASTPRRGGGGMLKAAEADEDEWLDAVQERVMVQFPHWYTESPIVAAA